MGVDADRVAAERLGGDQRSAGFLLADVSLRARLHDVGEGFADRDAFAGELRHHAEVEIPDALVEALVASGEAVTERGRFVLAGEEASIDELERRERFFPRKWQKI